MPPTVTQVCGVDDGKIRIQARVADDGGVVVTHDITGAFTVSGGAIALNENGVVTIGGETIPVKPMIGELDGDATKPFTVGEGSVTVTVRAIPGLKYELWRGERIGSGGIIDPAISTGPVVATGTRVTLEDTEHPTDKAFYLVEVSMP